MEPGKEWGQMFNFIKQWSYDWVQWKGRKSWQLHKTQEYGSKHTGVRTCGSRTCNLTAELLSRPLEHVTDKKNPDLKRWRDIVQGGASQLDMWSPAAGKNRSRIYIKWLQTVFYYYIAWLSEEPYLRSISTQIKGQKNIQESKALF